MDIYQRVTDLVVEMLRAGIVAWHRPWTAADQPRNLASGRMYRGINVFTLLAAGYDQPYWLTEACALKRGGKVRDGEKPWIVVSMFTGASEDSATGDKSFFPILRHHHVYNIAQCDGIAGPKRRHDEHGPEPIPRCAEIVSQMPNSPEIRHGGARAYYMPRLDRVQLPPMSCFDSPEAYYSTAFHELGHATGHDTRLGRIGVTNTVRFGDHTYAQEELVAEMAAAFLCGHAGIEARTIDNSAAYLGGWLRRFRSEPRCLVIAGMQAQSAADYILRRHPKVAAGDRERWPVQGRGQPTGAAGK